MLTDNIRRGIAVHPFGARIPRRHPPIRIEHHDGVIDDVHDAVCLICTVADRFIAVSFDAQHAGHCRFKTQRSMRSLDVRGHDRAANCR